MSFRKINYYIRYNINQMINKITPSVNAFRWRLIKDEQYKGVTTEKRLYHIVVSLTTYPGRIHTVDSVIKSLLMQKYKPNKIILWLAEEQFPNRENELPSELLDLRRYGLDICWCKDIRSYKKLIPTINLFPDSLIITADDDVIYSRNMVKYLVRAAADMPDCIHCHRATMFKKKDDGWEIVPGGYSFYHKPSYKNKLVGCAGVAYPPHVLDEDVDREDLFMNLAPTNDDLWFWLMGVKHGTKCNVVPHSIRRVATVPGSQETSLSSVNDNGEKLFWKQLDNILKYYPKLNENLSNDF